MSDGDAIASGRDEHRERAPERVAVAIVTVSDTRSSDDDPSGDWLAAAVRSARHRVAVRRWVPDDPEAIDAALEALTAGEADAVISTGGTGVAGRDNTVPVVRRRLVKPLPGFGELFRMLSYREVGAAAMLSRALGGVASGALLFALPGSKNAVKTAWEGLLEPELAHLVFEMRRQGGAG